MLQRGRRNEGLRFLRDTADQELVEAQLQLLRASPSEVERRRYLEVCAVSGNPEAQWELRRIYQDAGDAKMTLRCFKRAADAVRAAVSRLAESYENGDADLGISPDDGKMRYWRGRESKNRAAEEHARGVSKASQL
jgi:hypothetical protein